MAESARTGDGRGEAPIADETIFALSSGSPPAAIAVVRISGPRAGAALVALTGRSALPAPRVATLAKLHDANGLVLDRALTSWFPGPRSASGEDLVELHLHGGRAVVAAVLAALGAIDGLRPAEPGAFTRRAFANGRLDLAEAEALGDLLAAETERQRRAAVAQLEGGLTRLIGGWQERVLRLSAEVEALIDFSDEDDVGEGDVAALAGNARGLADEIAAELANPPAERLRDGLRVVVAGAPNAGKSTLINALVGREVAIATPIAGTTRDIIEVPVVIEGIAMILTDTAGLRDDSDDPIETIGIARARDRIAAADIVLALDGEVSEGELSGATIRVAAKSDVEAGRPGLAVSALTGAGMEALRAALVAKAQQLLPPPDRVALNARHRAALERAAHALRAAAPEPILLAEDLRVARNALAAITGRGDTEAMLDTLFGRFCIGK